MSVPVKMPVETGIVERKTNAMNEWLNPDFWLRQAGEAWAWFGANVLTIWTAAQVGVALLLALLPAVVLARYVGPRLKHTSGHAVIRELKTALADIAMPATWTLLLWFATTVFAVYEWPHRALEIGASLLTAWVVIRLVSRVVRNPVAANAIVWVAWTIAALNILELLEPMVTALDSLAFSFKDNLRISAYDIVKSTLALAVLLWIAIQAGKILESRIRSSDVLSPSLKVLMSKSLHMVFIGLAVIIALNTVGIDLTTLAVFGGAIGLGIGFGLQKIVSNLISGVILLLDKSIKPGDVIAVEDTYGWVNTLGGRYVSVVTRDGNEHLIPNETLITERVENWTHSDRKLRVKAPVGIHYDADPHRAIEICIEAARTTDRIIDSPGPVCLLREFGDNSVNLEVRFWIRDAQNGVANVVSEVLLKIWDAFKEAGIEIPYPQRDLHLRSSDVPIVAEAR